MTADKLPGTELRGFAADEPRRQGSNAELALLVLNVMPIELQKDSVMSPAGIPPLATLLDELQQRLGVDNQRSSFAPLPPPTFDCLTTYRNDLRADAPSLSRTLSLYYRMAPPSRRVQWSRLSWLLLFAVLSLVRGSPRLSPAYYEPPRPAHDDYAPATPSPAPPAPPPAAAAAAPAPYVPRKGKAAGRPGALQHPLPEAIRSFRFNAPPSPTPHSPLHPTDPTVDDLVLSPLVLAVTVDGHVHALNRETGQWVWTLHDDGGVALGGASKREQQRRLKAGEAVGGPLVKGFSRRKTANAEAAANGTGLALPTDELEDEMYVIEPFSGGDIYLHTRSGDDAEGEGELQKLPLSMQELVAKSPFSFPSLSSRIFIGKKDTKFVGVDLRTGRLVGVFGADAGWCEWDEQREGRVLREEEYDEEISRRPEDLLYMARTGAS